MSGLVLSKYVRVVFSVAILEWDASFDKPDAITSEVSSGSLCSVRSFLIIVNCSLLLAANVINDGSRLGCYFGLCH